MIWSKTSMAFCYLKHYHPIFVSFRGIPQLANFTARLLHAHPAARRVTNKCFFRPFVSTVSPKSSIEYRRIDGLEHLELYEPGGYHPVEITDILHSRYRIVDKLGFGGYSTIWLARDEKDKRYVAVKIGTSSPSLPLREVDILLVLNGPGSSSQETRGQLKEASPAAVPAILDAFDVRGPNGTHRCYTMIPTQGNLREASFSRLFPVQVARALAAKLATAVAFVHSRGFVHGGLFDYVSELLLYPELT